MRLLHEKFCIWQQSQIASVGPPIDGGQKQFLVHFRGMQQILFVLIKPKETLPCEPPRNVQGTSRRSQK